MDYSGFKEAGSPDYSRTGNSPLFDKYLKAIGAAEAGDNIFGSACFCPITDLENADEDPEEFIAWIGKVSGLTR